MRLAPRSSETDSIRILSVVLAAGAVAAWIDLGRLHTLQNADSLLLVLISLQHWTPFYWGQDRFGMLVPLLASWVRDPLANLLVQGWITTMAALLAPFLAARLLLPKAADWVFAGTAANGLLLAAASPALRFDWFVTQPCGMALTLGCAGFLVLDGRAPWRRVAGCLVLAAAHWVDEGIVLLLLPLACVRSRDGLRVWRVGGVIAAAAAGLLFARTVDAPHTTASMSPLSVWPHAWVMQVTNTVSFASGRGITVGAAVVGVACIWRLLVHQGRPPALVPGVILLVALLSGIATGTLDWVADNSYAPRYIYPPLALMGVAGGSYLEMTITSRRRWRNLAVALTVVVVAAASGWPSVQMIRRELHTRYGTMSSEVVHLGVTVIGGNYWVVWPSVFEANLTAASIHSGAVIYGLTSRSGLTDGAWRSHPGALLASVPGDSDLEDVAARAQVHLTLLGSHPTFDLYSVSPVGRASAPESGH